MDFTLNSPSQNRSKCPLLFVAASWGDMGDGVRDRKSQEQAPAMNVHLIRVRGKTIMMTRNAARQNRVLDGLGTTGQESGESQATFEIKRPLAVQSLVHLLAQWFHQLRNLLLVSYRP